MLFAEKLPGQALDCGSAQLRLRTKKVKSAASEWNGEQIMLF